MVPLSAYGQFVDELSVMLRSLKDPRTGEAAVAEILTPVADDPLSAHPTQADLIVSFNGAPLALEHPDIGIVGPAPFRRTGGHTGPFGMLYISDTGVFSGDHGIRSSFDVVPTIASLLGEKPSTAMSGDPIAVPRQG